MTREELYPPRTLADALTYYADADLKNAINTAKAEAKVEANVEAARKMKSKGFSVEDIAEVTGLSVEETDAL